jgi:TetR/AcrR family transcriptional regulator
MSDTSSLIEPADSVDAEEAPAARKRPKPGERRVQILQALAAMLEQPGADASPRPHWLPPVGERSGAVPPFRQQGADVRGLIEFIEQSVFTLVQQITGRDVPPTSLPKWGCAMPAASGAAAAVWRTQPRHGARDGGRCAGV